MDHAQKALARTYALQLQKLLPQLKDVEWNAIGVALVDAAEGTLVERARQREEDMQHCLQSLLDIYGGMLSTAWERIETLEAERVELHQELAQFRTPSEELASR